MSQSFILYSKLIILLPGNKIILFLTITIFSKSLNKFSSTLLLLKRKRLQEMCIRDRTGALIIQVLREQVCAVE